MCTHSDFEITRYMGNKGNGLTSSSTPQSFIIWTQPGITPEPWKAYLKEQCDAGTPVTIVYELREPVWEPFPAATQDALNALTTYRGYTCVGVSDPLQPDVSLSYVQDTRKVIESLQLDTAEQMIELQAQIDQLMVSNHLTQ